MLEDIKISIITPSFNQGDYIEQTILSILDDQDYKNVEYIIMDGGSTDQTVDIIKKYEDRISYWQSAPDGGQTEAINAGFKKCTGDIVTWICSDDYYEPGVFKKAVAAFKENSSINLFAGDRRLFGDSIEDKTHTGWWNADSLEKTLIYGEWNQPGSFFRREVWETLFPLDESLNVMMDNELWFRYLFKYGTSKVKYVPTTFAHGRYHDDSKSIKDYVECYHTNNAFYSSILKQISPKSELVAKMDQLPKIQYSNNWKIPEGFNKQLYCDELFGRYQPYFEDNQYFDRQCVHFYMYIQKYLEALTSSMKLLLSKPFSKENQSLFSISLKSYLKNL